MKVIFAGGGTGGHLMAGLSIAQEISSRYPHSRIVFFGTNKRSEKDYFGKGGYEFKQIVTCRFASFIRIPVFAFASLMGIMQSFISILKIKPDIMIGMGGYGSVLPVIAAYILGIPIVLIEQNVVPGRANLFMARWADAVLCHWESSRERFKNRHVSVTGVPVRNGIAENKSVSSDNPFGLTSQRKTLLIMGGSQGALAINEVVLKSVPGILSLIPDLQIIHLTGKHGYRKARDVYDRTGIRYFVSEFYHDVGAAYRLSDLIISRAGANTIAEITAVGIPAILIPYPYATDNHQYWNAYELSSAGGALIIQQDKLEPERIIKEVSELLMNDKKLSNMKRKSKSLRKPFAAAKVVDKICQILEEKRGKQKSVNCTRSVSVQES